MIESVRKFIGIELNKKWSIKFALSLILPFLLILIKPKELSLQQSIILATLILVIIWWSTDIIKKIPASIILLLVFTLFRAAPTEVIFSFPLSETFLQIVLTYVFSRGIVNSGLIEKLIEPKLFKWCTTPIRIMVAIIVLYVLTIYIIPQPIARLIIISNIIYTFLKETDLPEDSVSVLMFASFSFYTVVNIGALDADIIMNNAALSFANQSIHNWEWMKYMLVPTVVYGSLIFFLFVIVFRKQILNLKVHSQKKHLTVQALTKKEKVVILIVLATVLFWMTVDLHHLSPVIGTAVGIIMLYLLQVIRLSDLNEIDISTLVFLTAAFSIGGAMKESGIAAIIFGSIHYMFPENFGILYLIAIAFITMVMHMILGSNITTLSVVTPALLVISQGQVSPQMLVYILIITVSFHAILPFHNVGIMIGNSKGYYPAKYIAKLGLAATPLVYLSIILIYYPWWRLLGLK